MLVEVVEQLGKQLVELVDLVVVEMEQQVEHVHLPLHHKLQGEQILEAEEDQVVLIQVVAQHVIQKVVLE